MPTVLREGSYRLFFFSTDCAEPAHVHVQRDRRVAKVWLHDTSVASSGGFTPPELGRIISLIRTRKRDLLDAWNQYCSS